MFWKVKLILVPAVVNEVHHYAHGRNCAGAMGKGIALQFKERFPKMYLEYKQLCKEKKLLVVNLNVRIVQKDISI